MSTVEVIQALQSEGHTQCKSNIFRNTFTSAGGIQTSLKSDPLQRMNCPLSEEAQGDACGAGLGQLVLLWAVANSMSFSWQIGAVVQGFL